MARDRFIDTVGATLATRYALTGRCIASGAKSGAQGRLRRRHSRRRLLTRRQSSVSHNVQVNSALKPRTATKTHEAGF